MRIDFNKLYQLIDYDLTKEASISEEEWEDFGKILNPKIEEKQMVLF